MLGGLREQLQYAFHRLLRTEQADFIDMGLGIRARHRRCATHWQRHLELSRSFQGMALAEANGKCAVFGAGALLDVDLANLCGIFEHVDLFDADPSVSRVWNRIDKTLRPKVTGHILDVTNSLQVWSSALRKFLSIKRGERDLVEFLEGLETGASEFAPGSFSSSISCNLLSQIPIYWRERALQLIEPLHPASTEIARALETTMGKLQRSHLEMMLKATTTSVVLIFDSDFFYYQDHKAKWLEECALFTTIDYSGWNVERSDSWLWHIAPQHIEQSDYGVIHQVKALHLTREAGSHPSVRNPRQRA